MNHNKSQKRLMIFPSRVGRFIRSVKRIAYWLPVIWRDQDWDHVYLWRVLAHKLSSMERFFDGDAAISAGAKKTARRIKEARCLCERLRDEVHYGKAFFGYYGKWGEPNVWFSKYDESHGLLHVNVHPRAKTEREIKMATKEYAMRQDTEKYLIEQDLARIGEILAKYSRGWWD